MSAHHEELLAQLPDEIRRRLSRALARGATEEPQQSVEAAFEGVEFPGSASLWDPYVLPEELTRAQRAVAELSLSMPDAVVSPWRLPPQPWVRRRWLGLEAGGPFEARVDFEDGERRKVPLWRAMQVLTATDETMASELFARLELPLAQRLEAFGDATLGAYRIDPEGLPWGSLDEIGAEGVDWAPRFADRLLALTSTEASPTERVEAKMSVCSVVFLSLARAGVPIEPRWERFLPVGPSPKDVAVTKECLRALPEERRSPALVAALEPIAKSWWGALAGLALLPDYPSPELAKLLLKHGDQHQKTKEALAQIRKVAKEHPDVAAVLEGGAPKKEKAFKLSCPGVRELTRLEELTAVQQEQIVVLGRLYDGEEVDAAARMAADGEASLVAAGLSLFEVVDADGKPAFDDYRVGSDSGAVFRAGTTEVVGVVVQHNLTCEGNPALEKALSSYEVGAKKKRGSGAVKKRKT